MAISPGARARFTLVATILLSPLCQWPAALATVLLVALRRDTTGWLQLRRRGEACRTAVRTAVLTALGHGSLFLWALRVVTGLADPVTCAREPPVAAADHGSSPGVAVAGCFATLFALCLLLGLVVGLVVGLPVAALVLTLRVLAAVVPAPVLRAVVCLLPPVALLLWSTLPLRVAARFWALRAGLLLLWLLRVAAHPLIEPSGWLAFAFLSRTQPAHTPRFDVNDLCGSGSDGERDGNGSDDAGSDDAGSETQSVFDYDWRRGWDSDADSDAGSVYGYSWRDGWESARGSDAGSDAGSDITVLAGNDADAGSDTGSNAAGVVAAIEGRISAARFLLLHTRRLASRYAVWALTRPLDAPPLSETVPTDRLCTLGYHSAVEETLHAVLDHAGRMLATAVAALAIAAVWHSKGWATPSANLSVLAGRLPEAPRHDLGAGDTTIRVAVSAATATATVSAATGVPASDDSIGFDLLSGTVDRATVERMLEAAEAQAALLARIVRRLHDAAAPLVESHFRQREQWLSERVNNGSYDDKDAADDDVVWTAALLLQTPAPRLVGSGVNGEPLWAYVDDACADVEWPRAAS